jgi:hypothetical protein
MNIHYKASFWIKMANSHPNANQMAIVLSDTVRTGDRELVCCGWLLEAGKMRAAWVTFRARAPRVFSSAKPTLKSSRYSVLEWEMDGNESAFLEGFRIQMLIYLQYIVPKL